jgi:hypothetical protein
MKRMLAFVFAMFLALGISGLAQAQDDPATAAKMERSEKAFKNLGGSEDKLTKDAFMAAVQKHAEARWAKLDPAGKGFVTKEDFLAGRAKVGAKMRAKKNQAPAAQ